MDPLRPFRQDLKLVPVRPVHYVENLLDVGKRHLVVEIEFTNMLLGDFQ